MSRTTSATIDQLLTELAQAIWERDQAVGRLQALTTPPVPAGRRERYRQECEREAVTWSTEARRLLDSGEVPPDPFAQAHRKTLWDALREGTT